MGQEHNHSKKREDLSFLQRKYHRLDPNFVSRVFSYFPKENFDKFQKKMKKPQRASDIQNLLDTQAINMYGGIPDSTYRRIDDAQNQSNYNSLGFYKWNSPNPDKYLPDDIFLSPKAKGHTFLHELGHPYGSHSSDVGDYHHLSPQDHTAQKIGRTKLGTALGIGGIKTKRGYIKEYGEVAGLQQWKDVHEKGMHPYTTQTFYDHKFEDTSNMPQTLLDSLNTQTYKYHDESPKGQYFRQHGELPPRPEQKAIRNVRGWLKNNVPWMKKGEGWLPDNIYKQGSWFGM